MKSYLLSALARTLRDADDALVRQRYPHPWLLWEPGRWRPPLDSTQIAVGRGAGAALAPRGKVDEALAMALEPPKDGRPQLLLGRAPNCDLTVNDATLSRVHLLFAADAQGWSVEDAGSSNGSDLNGQPLQPGSPRRLTPGALLRAGDVYLTYLLSDGLLRRLREGARP